jgi:RimJ/RimL family protein N-acetyltransferase
MREATAYAFDELGLEVLTGEVLAHNTVVRQMNRRFRFAEGTPEIRYADGRELTVIPISLRKQDRRQGNVSERSEVTIKRSDISSAPGAKRGRR